jgi:hypothetical protein
MGLLWAIVREHRSLLIMHRLPEAPTSNKHIGFVSGLKHGYILRQVHKGILSESFFMGQKPFNGDAVQLLDN